jgi:hypothetical protein
MQQPATEVIVSIRPEHIDIDSLGVESRSTSWKNSAPTPISTAAWLPAPITPPPTNQSLPAPIGRTHPNAAPAQVISAEPPATMREMAASRCAAQIAARRVELRDGSAEHTRCAEGTDAVIYG